MKIKNNRGGGFLKIRTANKQGYILADYYDGIDISRRMQYHRGTVQKGMSLTIKTQIDVGVIVKDER